MKKTLLLLTAMLMTLSLLAQTSEKISIQVSDKPLYEVLSDIQSISGLKFFYSRDAVALQKKVTFSAAKEPAKAAITRLLKEHGIDFTINGTDVIVLAESSKKEKKLITGTVVDDMGYPLPGGGHTSCRNDSRSRYRH